MFTLMAGMYTTVEEFSISLAPNEEGLWALGGLRERSLSHSDEVNAGAKLAECTSASL